MAQSWLFGDADSGSETPPRLLVTGAGGAGKSHILKALRRIVARLKKRHVTLAYMGTFEIIVERALIRGGLHVVF